MVTKKDKLQTDKTTEAAKTSKTQEAKQPVKAKKTEATLKNNTTKPPKKTKNTEIEPLNPKSKGESIGKESPPTEKVFSKDESINQAISNAIEQVIKVAAEGDTDQVLAGMTLAEQGDDSKEKFEVMPMIPLRGLVVFPHAVIHLDVGRERSINALDEAMLENRELFVVMQNDIEAEIPTFSEIYNVGTIVEVKQVLKLPGGAIRLMVEGLCRGVVKQIVQAEPFMVAKIIEKVDAVDLEGKKALEIQALMRTMKTAFEHYAVLSKKVSPDLANALNILEDPGRLADSVANLLNLQLVEKQKVLATIDVPKRLNMLLKIILKETEILELERKIGNRVRSQIEKNQKEYYLKEQIRAIRKELGEEEDRNREIDEYRDKMEEAKLPQAVADKIEKEISRLKNMPPMAAESAVITNYIGWLLDLPWAVYTKDNKNILAAEKILNDDHYGLEKIKERIVEYLAVKQLTNTLKGPILCFVGPPGVGKTSLAASIARALNRKFVRLSFGGVRDEAEIRGHRRTYIGAMPGRIMQSMKTAGTSNPLFLFDEIDKLANDFRGDPASALLEVLDPAQNNSFSDHYIELPYDLSQVMFVTTANVEQNIPAPLWDRMEIIRLAGYTEEEKLQIAIRHLIPKQIKEHGLTDKKVAFSDNAIREIIRSYTREAGVRSLERAIAKVCRKSARDIVAKKSKHAKITSQNLTYFLSTPIYRYDIVDQQDYIGAVTGLAWTAVGGDVLTIEAQALAGKGHLALTGNLGDVMKESAQTGWTYLRSISKELGIPADVGETTDLHIHVPEGAIPKDGPSAGVTMATALASIFTNRKVRHDVAMTGEITLRGRVLPIGGVKEKVLAAHRSGVKVIILPKDNQRDLEEIPANVKRKLTFHFVENLKEVLEIALLPKEH